MGPDRRRFLGLVGLGITGLAGCARGPVDESASQSDGSTLGSDSPAPPPSEGPFGFTHLRPDGNRVLDGTGSLPERPLTRELDMEPTWLVGLPAASGSRWIAVGADGNTVGLRVIDGAIEEAEPAPADLPPGVPPVLAPGEPQPRLLAPPLESASTLTHPFPLGDGRSLVVGRDGDVLLWDGELVERLSASVLPDARFLRVTEGTYAVLAGATDRYDHGALGDDTEAGALLLLEVGEGLSRRARIGFEGPVAEGLQPIAAGFQGAAEPVLLVTLTDRTDGARLAAFDLEGQRVATGPSVGTGFRWRHQLCLAPFGPDGTPEIAAVKTPHIGGIVEFYRRRGDRLEIVAEAGDYASHTFGSRNLDGGLAADLDGDGTVELLLPTQSRDTLRALRRTSNGLESAFELQVPPRLSTNVAGLDTGDGILLAAGTTDGTVRVWS